MKRPGYREAIEWLALNDDCYWLDGEAGNSISVCAAMVRDLFGVTDEKLNADLIRACKKNNHPVFRS